MRETYCRTMIQRYASLVRNHCNKQIPAPRASRRAPRARSAAGRSYFAARLYLAIGRAKTAVFNN